MELIGNNLISQTRAASGFYPIFPTFVLVCQGHTNSHMGTPREVVHGHARSPSHYKQRTLGNFSSNRYIFGFVLFHISAESMEMALLCSRIK